MSTTTRASSAPSDFLTVHQAARELHSGPRTIYRAVRDGRLRAAKLNDRGDLRILRAWLVAYVEALAGGAQ
jgi:excisionase family DNA binding protein